MTIDTTGFTLGTNQPLNHARILWQPITGTITTDGGTNGDYAANDYTAQRWALAAGACYWTLATDADAEVDCCFIAAHNLSGKTVTIKTSSFLSGAMTTRATVTPADNTAICVLFNYGDGTPITVRRVHVAVSDGTDIKIGIIRFGVALQMPIPIYGGHGVITQNRITEAQQQFSETGQWLGRSIKRQAITAGYTWDHVSASWYATNFDPFAATLPLHPFGIAGNPSKMTGDVAWGWTDEDIRVTNEGRNNWVSFGLNVTGFSG